MDQDWKAQTRNALLDMARRGLFPPDEIEREAVRRGVGPLAHKPDPSNFDPEGMFWWSLPMALAWIAWRNTEAVREHCAEYREDWIIWVPRSSNVPVGDGFARVDGHELKSVGRSTACRLALIESSLKSSGNLPPTTKMTVSEAEQELFDALAAGRIVAIGKDRVGEPLDIPQREWPYLQLFEEQECDVLKRNALDREATYSEIRLRRDDVKNLWQQSLIESCMIEPMMREGSAGYVPLCSALHWIMTEGGNRVDANGESKCTTISRNYSARAFPFRRLAQSPASAGPKSTKLLVRAI